MDEALKAQMVEFAKRLLDAAETGATFAAEQTPLLVQEWLRWELASSLIYAGLAVVVIAACVYGCVRAVKMKNSDDAENMFLACFVMGIVALVVAGINTHDAIKVWVAPRVVIVERIKGLL
jgi:heme/copper-type cytochrome/quinol oxidase subunit 2